MAITGVPFYVFNEKILLSGAQPVDVLVQALEKSKWRKKQKHPYFFVRSVRTVYSAGDEGVMGLMQPSPF